MSSEARSSVASSSPSRLADSRAPSSGDGSGWVVSSSWRARSRARSTARARRLLVLIASTEVAFVRIAGATISERTANGFA